MWMNGSDSLLWWRFPQALAWHRQGRNDEAANAYNCSGGPIRRNLDALIHLGAASPRSRPAGEAETLLRRGVSPNGCLPLFALRALPSLSSYFMLFSLPLPRPPFQREKKKTKNNSLRAPRSRPSRHCWMPALVLAASLQASGRPEAAISAYERFCGRAAHPEANYGLATLLAHSGRAETVAKYRASGRRSGLCRGQL